MVNGQETLTYEAMTEIRNNIDTIANEMREQLRQAEEIIASCENDGIFVTDKGSVAMQEQFSRLAQSFDPFIEKLKQYSDFLTNELNTTYQSTDQNLANVWEGVAESIGNVANN